jgi:hypothetical protein
MASHILLLVHCPKLNKVENYAAFAGSSLNEKWMPTIGKKQDYRHQQKNWKKQNEDN